MSVNIHLLKASGRLESVQKTIKDAADNVIADVSEVIDLPDVDIVIADSPVEAIKEVGVGGTALTKHYVRVAIDPEHENVEENLAYEIKSTIAHELHHCSRWHACGKADTLLDELILEGLADHFDLAINGGEPQPWSVAHEGERLEELIQKAKSKFDDEDYDYRGWFFGTGEDDIPRWAGYSIAFSLVGDYLEETGKSAAEVTDQPTGAFVK